MKATVEELMTLLAKVSGWGDQSLSVKIGFKRARVYDSQDESHLDENDRGFTASTSICGGSDIATFAPTLEEALYKLVAEAQKATRGKLLHQRQRLESMNKVVEEFEAFLENRDGKLDT